MTSRLVTNRRDPQFHGAAQYLQIPDPGLAAARLQCRCVLHHDRPHWCPLVFPRLCTAQKPLGLGKLAGQTRDLGFEMLATQDPLRALQAGLARHDCRRLSNTSTPHRPAPQLCCRVAEEQQRPKLHDRSSRVCVSSAVKFTVKLGPTSHVISGRNLFAESLPSLGIVGV